MSNLSNVLDHLFISKVRIKILKYFIFNMEDELHLRAIVREVDEEINAVRRELNRLEELGIFVSKERGNRKYFKFVPTHPLAKEIASLIIKCFGLGEEIIKKGNRLGDIRYAFFTPSFIFKSLYPSNSIDLVIIGKVDMNELEDIIQKTQKNLKKEIHYTVLTPNEFETRKKRGEQFVTNILILDRVMLIGREEELIRI